MDSIEDKNTNFESPLRCKHLIKRELYTVLVDVPEIHGCTFDTPD